MPVWQFKSGVGSADRLFFRFILDRDGHVCKHCGTDGRITELVCSYFFFKRRMDSVRFDPDNCDALCKPCRRYFYGKKGRPRRRVGFAPQAEPQDYRTWKIEQLGQQRFGALEILANTRVKRDHKMVVRKIKSLIADQTSCLAPSFGTRAAAFFEPLPGFILGSIMQGKTRI